MGVGVEATSDGALIALRRTSASSGLHQAFGGGVTVSADHVLVTPKRFGSLSDFIVLYMYMYNKH